jgi:hypothetical protein
MPHNSNHAKLAAQMCYAEPPGKHDTMCSTQVGYAVTLSLILTAEFNAVLVAAAAASG